MVKGLRLLKSTVIVVSISYQAEHFDVRYREREPSKMNKNYAYRYLLHVSDFHLSDDENSLDYAKLALSELAKKLRDKGIQIDYLIHTGDVIDSIDVFEKAANQLPGCKEYLSAKPTEYGTESSNFKFDFERFSKEAATDLKKKFDNNVKKLVTDRFNAACGLLREFFSELNVAPGNVIICCGNHDVLKPSGIDNKTITCTPHEASQWKYECPPALTDVFKPFESFLDKLDVANSQKRCKKKEPISVCSLGGFDVLILNTNWTNYSEQRPGYYCIRCDQLKEIIDTAVDKRDNSDKLSFVVAHKPIYEICERPRLAYKRYIETPFMSSLQKFIGNSGVYFCGDKHTRSIAHSSFHGINHYIGGEPLRRPAKGTEAEVEYNLLEIVDCKLGLERKIHMKYSYGNGWCCEIRPQDSRVSELYDISSKYIVRHILEILFGKKRIGPWDSLRQEILGWTDEKRKSVIKNFDTLFKSICKYRLNGNIDVGIKDNIFTFVLARIKKSISDGTFSNIINARGEYDSGKSTFWGLLYLYSLYKYSMGEIDFIPAYFNFENDEMIQAVGKNISYYDAAKRAFEDFSRRIQYIADKEHQCVCYIIDGLDEQDSWSLYTEDSIGRGVLDVLSTCHNTCYIMSFSQHRLPCFKNTMPVRKYNDTSDIIYFNPVDVREHGSTDKRFELFVSSYMRLMPSISVLIEDGEKQNTGSSEQSKNLDESNQQGDPKFCANVSEQTGVSESNETAKLDLPTERHIHGPVDKICDIIRRFRRLTISPGFLHQNFEYITEIEDYEKGTFIHENATVSEIYKYYIDRQDELCLKSLGYGYVNYAPAIAYLFAYKGYTYEKFMRLHEDDEAEYRHVISPICENRDKIYATFLFVLKHVDAREFLIALHYNRELRYYAEHPHEEIAPISILNEFLSRNISVQIRKLWSDTNKFEITCNQLIKRDNLSNCLQSMLIYCLSHMQMYEPIRDALMTKLLDKAEITLLKQLKIDKIEDATWEIEGQDYSEKLQCFINYSLLHTLVVYKKSNKNTTLSLAHKMYAKSYDTKHTNEQSSISSGFCRYNRQFQMLYYGDLFINGEDKQRPLDPSDDKVGKGFDFHNCFNYLLVKLNSADKYPLREFDMLTLFDLMATRLDKKYINNHHSTVVTEDESFFYRAQFSERAHEVLFSALNILDAYTSISEIDDSENCEDYLFFKTFRDLFSSEMKRCEIAEAHYKKELSGE